MIQKFAFFALFAVLFASCSLFEEPTASEVLQDKVWKLSLKTENATAVVLPTCTGDDKFTYSASGSFEHNYGTDKCLADPNTTTGNWSVENNDQTLKLVTTILGISRTTSYTIKSFTSKQVVLSYENTSIGGTTKTIEETYVPVP